MLRFYPDTESIAYTLTQWESVLLCQFHDCLPGSSIEMVYDESDALYKKLFRTGKDILDRIWQANNFSDSLSGKAKLFAVNTLPWKRTELVKLPGSSSELAETAPQYGIIRAENFGFESIEILPTAVPVTSPSLSIQEVTPGVFLLANEQLCIQVESGCITSLIDHSAGYPREVIQKGKKGNQLVIFDDKPLNWQAWDVEVYHLNSRQELASSQTRLLEDGPYKVSVVTECKISERSWAKTTISLSPVFDGQPSFVEINTEVEWRESMKFLKVEFPVSVTNKEASYETQFGVMTRPTHYNTTYVLLV
jgi:alpha-mannosidase